MSEYRLVLHPQAGSAESLFRESLVEALCKAEFIAAPWGEDGTRFLAGARFLDYIVFMGCSPHIVFEPPADGSLSFCHVQFSEISDQPRFRSASQQVTARCPRCGNRIEEWPAAVERWRADAATVSIRCGKCLAESSLYQLGWRHTAGFARMFIDVYGIYPQEGVPTDSLLDLLALASGIPWDYFYSDRGA